MADWIQNLERLSALRTAGHITDAEFDAAKAEVLAQTGLSRAPVTAAPVTPPASPVERAAPTPSHPPAAPSPRMDGGAVSPTIRLPPAAGAAAPAGFTPRDKPTDAPPGPPPATPTLRLGTPPDGPTPAQIGGQPGAAFLDRRQSIGAPGNPAPPPPYGPPLLSPPQQRPLSPGGASRGRGAPLNPLLIIGGVVAAILLVAAMVWALLPPTRPAGVLPHPAASATPVAFPAPLPPDPGLPPLAPGETLTWTGATAGGTVEREVGAMAVRIAATGSGETTAPVVDVSYGTASVRLTGDPGAPTAEHRITAVQNRAGAAPVVMLQSYTGGAHCCTHLQLAGLSGGQLRTVDLGAWDGDSVTPPHDVSGDGVADFVLTDQSFLYAFAPYAMSASVPRVLNVTGGRVVDVSARPAFRRLFADAMRANGETCRGGGDGMTRNGACAAYVAAAARAGRLDRAWQEMVSAYDASVEWQLPAGCSVAVGTGECPADRQIQYQSYPDALAAFLKRHGYVARSWQPPAPPGSGEDQPEPDTPSQDSGKN
ncbi:SHOCT domain-containing protein [Sphingomonas sp.]|uniref:SHOCT domain-containing protein n=1 Tax=Sphingomonas sp. TaxID=28214 RepID=UPI003CC5065D